MNMIPAIVLKIGLFPIAGSDNHSWRLEIVVSYQIKYTINTLKTDHINTIFGHSELQVHQKAHKSFPNSIVIHKHKLI